MNEPVTGTAAHEIREQLHRIQSGELSEHDLELKADLMSPGCQYPIFEY